uniref:ZP domain-containing protein n=1 Tax=Strongyloides papillosus TaxID=174720 RepID=A0A0N5CDX9_STREA
MIYGKNSLDNIWCESTCVASCPVPTTTEVATTVTITATWIFLVFIFFSQLVILWRLKFYAVCSSCSKSTTSLSSLDREEFFCNTPGVNVGATAASCAVNRSGQIFFTIEISVPKLMQFKIEFVSGVFAGSFPESIRALWLCGSVPGGNQVCNLNGLINLQILVVSSCAIMSQAMGTISVSNELRCILTLCKSAECRCGLLIKKKFENVFSTQVIIIPSGRYNGRLATTSESYRKAMFLRRKGIVFARGSFSFEKFATCNLPNDVQEELEEVKKSRSSIFEEVKKSRSSIFEKVDF